MFVADVSVCFTAGLLLVVDSHLQNKVSMCDLDCGALHQNNRTGLHGSESEVTVDNIIFNL